VKNSGKWLFTKQSGSITVLTVDYGYQFNCADVETQVQRDNNLPRVRDEKRIRS
jgi:hypothetical protein